MAQKPTISYVFQGCVGPGRAAVIPMKIPLSAKVDTQNPSRINEVSYFMENRPETKHFLGVSGVCAAVIPMKIPLSAKVDTKNPSRINEVYYFKENLP